MSSQRIRNGLLVVSSLWGVACAQFSGAPAGSNAGTGGAGAAGVASTGGTAAPGGSGGSSASGTGGAIGGGINTGSGGTAGTGGAPTGSGIIHPIDLTGKKVLFIVDDPSSLDDGDIMLRDMMAARGMVVTLASTTAPPAAVVVSSQDLIVGSSGAAGAEFGTLFKSSAVPILTFGNGYYQPLDFIATTAARGNAASTVMLTVVDATSHLAAGFAAGAVLAVISPTRNTQVYWATAAGAPTRIAQLGGNPTELCAFAYEKGAMMATAPAPGRRVSLCWKTDAIKDLAVDSYRLMNAAVEWTAGNL
jgi:hypothetical protein